MDPKVLILVAVIFAAVVILVFAISHVIDKFKEGSFRCAHCKRKCPLSEADQHFGEGVCKVCGEFLIPPNARPTNK